MGHSGVGDFRLLGFRCRGRHGHALQHPRRAPAVDCFHSESFEPVGNRGNTDWSRLQQFARGPGGLQGSGATASGDLVLAPAVFLFATKKGTILRWSPKVNPAGFDPAKAGKYAILAVNNSADSAHTGLTFATDAAGV